MLIKCPEYNKNVSNQAESCPHCGYSIMDNIEEIMAQVKKQEDAKSEKDKLTTQDETSKAKEFKKFLLVIFALLLVVGIIFGAILSIQNDRLSKYRDLESTLNVLEYLDNATIKEKDSIQSRKMIRVIDADIIHICCETDGHNYDKPRYNDYYYATYNETTYIYYTNDIEGKKCFYLGELGGGSCQYERYNAEFNAAKLAYRAYNNDDGSYPILYSEVIDKNIYDTLVVKLFYK